MKTEIWDKLCETDPKYTKGFKKGGGFSGTAINPTYGIKKLTEAFGPCGVGWGTEIVQNYFYEGRWLSERDREVIHTVILKLWFESVKDEKAEIKHVIGVGTTTFVGANKHGIYTDEEFFKKTMTDALSNASKQLGLSADIFMGLYDDSKYLNEVSQKFAPKPQMPSRASVNKDLLELKTIEQISDYGQAFQTKHGKGVWVLPSGKQGNKRETWGDLFKTHKDRVTGVPPVPASTGPEELQKEWDQLASTCKDFESYTALETMINQNRALDLPENWATLETIHKELEL